MKELLPLTPEQLARAEERLRHPAPGSRIEAARDFGIDPRLLASSYALGPTSGFARSRGRRLRWSRCGVARRRS